jgi:hypothetical protein
MKKFFKRLWRGWFPHHYLYVTHRGKEHSVYVTDFKKLSPKKISGYNKDGEYFEFISIEPMEYLIEEYRDDLYEDK